MNKSDLRDFMVVRIRYKNRKTISGIYINGLIITDCNKFIIRYFDEKLRSSKYKCQIDKISSFEVNRILIQKIIIEYYNCDGIYNYLVKDIIENANLNTIWEMQKEIDWNKVPKFTPVQVKDGDIFINRYFLYFNEKDYYRYVVTKCDKYTFSSFEAEKENYIEDEYIEEWDNCIIHPDVEIKEEWQK